MSDFIESLERAATLDAVAELTKGKAWKAWLTDLSRRSDVADDIHRLRRAVAEARYRLSPEGASEALTALRAKIFRDPTTSESDIPKLVAEMATVRNGLPDIQKHERLFGRIETAVEQMVTLSPSDVGQSSEGRAVLSQFSEFAGQQRILGASGDSHGNAEGARYDLGRDGAFTGQSVHVLQLYNEPAFSFKEPGAAFARKGFALVRRTEPGSADSFQQWLSSAQQLWVISTDRALLSKEHIEAIRSFWQRGGALYIWGDNKPYYADANAILKALFGPELSMEGDLPGGKVVHELNTDKQGFVSHLVTTGLVNLFEGITVASLNRDVCARHGFAPLMYGSASNLITVVREPTLETGAIMVDAAFTRLYCQWDEAGSARYVCNAACFLAAVTLTDDEDEASAVVAR